MTYHLKVISGKSKQDIVNPGGNILRMLSDNGIMLTSPCGGNRHCGKCKVKVSGYVSEITQQERCFLTPAEIEEGIRLACFCNIQGDTTIEIKETPADILLNGNMALENNSNKKVMKIDVENEHLGIAVDIGTTTLAAYLINLENAELLSSYPMLNPQRAFGADVITRIQYTMEHKNGLLELSTLIRKAISSLIKQCCMKANKKPSEVVYVMVAGNTIMLHILCNENVAGIAVAPYSPVFLEHREYKAADLDIIAHPDSAVSIIGSVSGYVGADIVAGIYNSKLYQSDGVNIFLDIGTNGEIVAGGKDRLVSCATAAGPAFEGGNIRFGMGGIEGAINSMKWKDGTFEYKVIGNTTAKGICGSGLLDAVAVLLDVGIIDETGKIDNSSRLCRQFENSMAVKLTKGIYITQKDIRQVQLAKAAISAGIEILLSELKAEHEDVNQVFLAGGFGSALNPRSACRLGIFDTLWQNRTVSLGNSSGSGAMQAVSNDKAFEQMNTIRKQIEYIELSSDKAFNNLFVDKITF